MRMREYTLHIIVTISTERMHSAFIAETKIIV